MKCRLFVGSLLLLDRVDQSQNQLAPWFGLGLYQEEAVGEAVDFQGVEVEGRRNEGCGYGVMGSESIWAAKVWLGGERRGASTRSWR